MASYADYSRNAYSGSVASLERHINIYPADENIPYAHYLIAICYYEQILDEKKDLHIILSNFNLISEKLKIMMDEQSDNISVSIENMSNFSISEAEEKS